MKPIITAIIAFVPLLAFGADALEPLKELNRKAAGDAASATQPAAGPTSPEAVVDSLVTAVSAIENDYPELEGFAKSVVAFRKKFPEEKLSVRFKRHVKGYAEMRSTRPDDIGKNGIELRFEVRDESNPGWTTGDNPHLPLKAMKKLVWSSLVLSPNPSAGLQQKLEAILAEHRTMLVKLDKRTAQDANISTPAAKPPKKFPSITEVKTAVSVAAIQKGIVIQTVERLSYDAASHTATYSCKGELKTHPVSISDKLTLRLEPESGNWVGQVKFDNDQPVTIRLKPKQ